MFGTGELIVLLLVVLVLFGGKKLPELARSIGLGIREFKKACHGVDDEEIFEKHNANKKTGSKNENAETVVIEIDPEHKDN